MECPRCRATLPSPVPHCPNCGLVLADIPQPPAGSPRVSWPPAAGYFVAPEAPDEDDPMRLSRRFALLGIFAPIAFFPFALYFACKALGAGGKRGVWVWLVLLVVTMAFIVALILRG